VVSVTDPLQPCSRLYRPEIENDALGVQLPSYPLESLRLSWGAKRPERESADQLAPTIAEVKDYILSHHAFYRAIISDSRTNLTLLRVDFQLSQTSKRASLLGPPLIGVPSMCERKACYFLTLPDLASKSIQRCQTEQRFT
jgi:hypothetical protein